MTKNFTSNFHTGELVETIGRALNGKRNGKGGFDLCDCPAHHGRECLSIDPGANGDILLRCHTGCGFDAVRDALRGMGLWPERGEGGGATTAEQAAESIARRRALEAEQAARHQDAAAKAKALYEAANIGADATAHPYNQERGGRWTGHTARRGNWPFHGGDADALLLPYTDTAGELRTLQAISGSGRPFSHGDKKDYYPGGAKRGNFYTFFELGEHVRRFFIGEGFFTVQAAQEAFYQTNGEPPATAPDGWITAGDAGNLEPVARAIHAAHPGAAIIILADEDGPGIIAANKAALAAGGKVARPSAGLPTGANIAKGYDFDNLLCEAGAGAVCAALDKAAKPEGGTVKDAGEAAYQEQAAAPAAQGAEDEAARRALIDEIKAGFWARRVSPKSSIENTPPERAHILRNYIIERTVGALSGAGGGGKSYQCLKIGMAITSGKQIEVFDPPEKGPVIYLSAEDDDGILWWRMHHLAAKYELSPYEVEEMERNFHPIDAGGFFKPIMERDRNGNPCETVYSEALREIIADVDPALVIIDPKADFYGIEENSNEDEAAWAGALRGMIQRDKRTAFLVVSHIAKGLDEDQREQAHAARGGTAFIDACRTAMNYIPARASEIKKYDLPTDAFKLIYTKGNYHKWPGPVFFGKDDYGIPVMIDTEALDNAKAAASYEDAVRAVPVIAQAWQAKGGPLNKVKWERNLGQDLTDPAKPKPGREQLAHAALIKYGITFDQVATAIAEAIRRGYVRAEPGERTAKHGPAPIVIVFDHFHPEEVGTL